MTHPPAKFDVDWSKETQAIVKKIKFNTCPPDKRHPQPNNQVSPSENLVNNHMLDNWKELWLIETTEQLKDIYPYTLMTKVCYIFLIIIVKIHCAISDQKKVNLWHDFFPISNT